MRVSSLACGDVEGRLNALFNRVQAIQKKTGQFDVSQMRHIIQLSFNFVLMICGVYICLVFFNVNLTVFSCYTSCDFYFKCFCFLKIILIYYIFIIICFSSYTSFFHIDLPFLQ